jgi:hypothetical protein
MQLSSSFQEPGVGSNNKEMVLHQVLVHSHGPKLMHLFSCYYKNMLIISGHHCRLNNKAHGGKALHVQQH